MQVNKEMNAMFSTKKVTMIFKYIVSKISVAALVLVVGMAGVAAAAGPRSTVISTYPTDDAINVPVSTSVTVNFSLPMDCKTLRKQTFRLKERQARSHPGATHQLQRYQRHLDTVERPCVQHQVRGRASRQDQRRQRRTAMG